LSGVANADQRLRRPPVAPPQAAIRAVEGAGVFAWLRSPAAIAVLGAAQLDRFRIVRMGRNAPVEAVAAEIEQPAASTDEAGDRIEAAPGVIFRMRAGDEATIGLQRRRAFPVEIVVGDQ